MSLLTCPYCKETERIVRAGYSTCKKQKQRYLCNRCKSKFIVHRETRVGRPYKYEPVICPYCFSNHTKHNGSYNTKSGGYRSLIKCLDCQKQHSIPYAKP